MASSGLVHSHSLNARRLFSVVLATLCSGTLFLFLVNHSTIDVTREPIATADEVSPKTSHNCSDPGATWRKWSSHIRACLLSRIRKSPLIWSTLHYHCATCVGEAGLRALELKVLQNKDDIKFAILPKSSYAEKTNSCTVVTLGVGNDVDAELKLQRMLPYCKFYGADPSLQAGSIYQTKLKGKYFQTAVTAIDGDTTASIMEKNGSYAWYKGVKGISLSRFLSVSVAQKRIDYMLMDNEGPEYEILEQFGRGGVLERDNVVVCQLSIELHGPLAKYGMNGTGFHRLIETVISKSPMLPLWASQPVNHIRSFFVNYQHPYCVEKYFLL